MARPSAPGSNSGSNPGWLRQTGRFAATLAVLLASGSGSAEAATTPLAAVNPTTLVLAPKQCAGPICVRPAARPYQHLAGFSLAVGSILLLAPRREPDAFASEADDDDVDNVDSSARS